MGPSRRTGLLLFGDMRYCDECAIRDCCEGAFLKLGANQEGRCLAFCEPVILHVISFWLSLRDAYEAYDPVTL
ncbi:MAG: hypothetical protein AMJ38_03120 [Dehalococcoidia bacterium DG_22]|nr:MAG: hypothetical protein AMJ38_03120 [Dehalococcoidia bacterium DG_22]